MNTDPHFYHLSSHIKLEATGNRTIGIRKVVKSRIIRKDAEKIIETANQIKHTDPTLQVALICTKNICSKSLKLLDDEGIEVKYVD